jgi:hypothetical protein
VEPKRTHWSRSYRSVQAFAVAILSAIALMAGTGRDAAAASATPAPGESEAPVGLVYLEVWPVIRAPDITEGRGDAGWTYTARFDVGDVIDVSRHTGFDDPAYWTLRLPIGTTARVALTQMSRDGFTLQRVTCTETPSDSDIDREVSVALEGSTATFEVRGVDPTYVCYFHNFRLGPPRTDTAAASAPSSDGSAARSLVILTATLTVAMALAMRRFRARPRLPRHMP